MLVTEEEAAALRCPLTMLAAGQAPATAACIASRCMAWRFADAEDRWEREPVPKEITDALVKWIGEHPFPARPAFDAADAAWAAWSQRRRAWAAEARALLASVAPPAPKGVGWTLERAVDDEEGRLRIRWLRHVRRRGFCGLAGRPAEAAET